MNPDIINHLNWAINTIRDKLMFGRDELGASLAREARAKGVMLDAVKYIQDIESKLIKYQEAYTFMKETLQEIADEDFRGNRPNASIKAYQVLKKIGAYKEEQ